MKITRREAKKRFEAGETVYAYNKAAVNEWDCLYCSFYALKPTPLRKYAPDVTWKDALAKAKAARTNDWFSTT